MRKTALVFLILCTGLITYGQDKKERVSPPAVATGYINGTAISIDYSQPSVKGRTIWGELVPYGKVWRAGANETTSITFSEDVKIQGKPLKKGEYAFFVIPGEKEWVIIFNETIKWGSYDYKEAEDVLRVKVPVNKSMKHQEKLMYEVSKNGGISLMWEKVKVSVKVS